MKSSSAQPRIVIVTRPTRLDGLLERWATRGQAKFAFQKARATAAVRENADLSADALDAMEMDALEDFGVLEDEQETYESALERVRMDLDLGLPVQVVERRFLPTFDFSQAAAVVTVGPDGLVANAAKYVGHAPIVGVNPDPARIDGVLLPFAVGQVRAAVQRTLKGQCRVEAATLAEARLHDGQRLLAFNDFYVGARTHVSARYELTVGGRTEPQSSSGVLVSTGAGSTGWMSSVVNMARGVAAWLGEEDPLPDPRIARTDAALLWAVREPFASRTSRVGHVAGRVGVGEELLIESRMGSEGVIFSDGVEADALDFSGGAVARIGVASQTARLVVG